MLRNTLFFLLLFTTAFSQAQREAAQPVAVNLIEADNPAIQYTGRIDFTNPKRPKFWAPGVYIQAKFTGRSCDVVLSDEVYGGKNHNYIAIVVDRDPPIRLQMRGKTDTIRVVRDLPDTEHTLTICKNTESNIGYVEFVGLLAQGVAALPPKPTRRIEFIGNSITCGTGSDESVVPCDKGPWYDQHNAYLSYGPTVARQLNAQWQLTSVSGIGLIHSCCNMTLTMPDVFDKVNLRDNALPWDFGRYIPDVVTVCLGQNDGIQDSTAFCGAYVRFIDTLRSHYPTAHVVCLTSPMANAKLTAVQQKYLTSVVAYCNGQNDKRVHSFFFSRSYNSGCGGHPSLAEHALIAGELSAFVKQTLNW